MIHYYITRNRRKLQDPKGEFPSFVRKESEKRASRREKSGKRPLCFCLGSGALTGLIGSLFGSGGGIVAVFALRRLLPKDREKEAYAGALAATLPLSALSAALYGWRGGFAGLSLGVCLPYLSASAFGGVLGRAFADRMPAETLRRLFGILLVIAGGALLLRG